MHKTVQENTIRYDMMQCNDRREERRRLVVLNIFTIQDGLNSALFTYIYIRFVSKIRLDVSQTFSQQVVTFKDVHLAHSRHQNRLCLLIKINFTFL